MSLRKKLIANSEAWHRRMASVPVVLRWLCEQAVRALLRGAWSQVHKRQGAAYDRAFEMFNRLVDAAPCWPCRIEYSKRATQMPDGGFRAGLCIMTGRAAEEAEQFEEEIYA